jgi:drug/metabolite transporter (DMT)-like permease
MGLCLSTRGERPAVERREVKADVEKAAADAPDDPSISGTIFAFCFLTFVAVTKTILTKSVFMHVPQPVAYSVLSCVVTAICLGVIFLCQPHLYNTPNSSMIAGFTAVCIAIALDLACTNVAISLLSVALQQCIRAASPAATVILESFYNRHCRHPLLYVVVLLLCTGPVLAQMGSSSFDSTPLGLAMMCAAVVAGAFKYVLAHAMIRGYKKSLGTLSFTFWIEIAVAIMLTPWAVLNGEARALFTSGYSGADWGLLIFTAAYGGVRIYSQFALLEFTSATTLSLTNVAIQAGTIGFGFFFFGTELTFYLGLGISVTLFFSAVYTYISVFKVLEKLETKELV